MALRSLPGLRSARVLGLPVGDVALALAFTLAAIIWVALSRHLEAADDPVTGSVLPGPAKFPDPPSAINGARLPTELVAGSILAGLKTNIAATASLALRRRWPLVAFAVGFGTLFVVHEGLAWPGFLALLILAYSVVAHGRRLPVGLGVLFLAAAWVAREFHDSVPPMPGWLSSFALLAPLGLFATVIRATRARADAAARRAVAMEREQEASTRAALAEERGRIARELHDVVSHHVSVMVIQAGAAKAVLARRPDLAADALHAIGASGREAMAELRHLLGLLAPLDDALHPQPGLADLDALVDKVRAAGQPVTVSQVAAPLAHGIDLTAYRVVQEGLTNALRYAPGAPTHVEVRQDDVALVVEVRNDAVSADRPPVAELGSGSGLVGLAERLRLFDGTLDCGRRLGGGFSLRAWIPLPADGIPTG